MKLAYLAHQDVDVPCLARLLPDLSRRIVDPTRRAAQGSTDVDLGVSLTKKVQDVLLLLIEMRLELAEHHPGVHSILNPPLSVERHFVVVSPIAPRRIETADLVAEAPLVVAPWPVNASSPPEIPGHGCAGYLSKIAVWIMIAGLQSLDNSPPGLLGQVLSGHSISLGKVPGPIADVVVQLLQPR